MERGDTIPDVKVTLHDETATTLTELLESGPIVLFFYPKAFTSGCTAEARHFRDLAGEFAEVGAQPIGVSRDDTDTQARFRDEHQLGFPLIADPDGELADLLGAKRFGPMPPRRRTFVIDTDRRVLGEISSETNMERHADEALALLRQR